MSRASRALLLAIVSTILLVSIPVLPRAAGETTRAELGLALRRLNTAATFMMITAHPDDENNSVLARVSQGLGARTVVATLTHGEGGQNEIGPELFEALSVLRSEELLAAHRTDGAEQYFSRAVDFGYSFSVDETFEKWNKDIITGDAVRLIRTIRPDVIVAMSPRGTGGGQHHQASALIARDAFRAAADSSRYPDQIKDGLKPWQPKKFYFMASWGARGEPTPAGKVLLSVPTEIYDPLLGRTYADAGSEARSMHKCQGFGQLLVLPGDAGMPRYELVDAAEPSMVGREESSFFEGLDVSVDGLTQYDKTVGPAAAGIAGAAHAAQEAFDRGEDAAVVKALVAGLGEVRAVRARKPLFDAEFRLAQKERQFEDALLMAHALRIETLSNDGVVVAGQPIQARVIVADRSGLPASVKSVTFAGVSFAESAPQCAGDLSKGQRVDCTGNAAISAKAATTDIYWERRSDSARYDFAPGVPFGVPFPASPFRASITLDLSGAEVTVDQPLQYRYEGNIFSGEKRMELSVVPRLAVNLTPEVALIPLQSRARELTVTVVNGARAAASGQVRVVAPAGWSVKPASAPLSFAREDEAQTAKFTVTAPPGVKPGDYRVSAVADLDGMQYDKGYQVVEYPHTHRRQLIHQAQSTLKVLDVKVAPRLTVGYIMGVGDQVPLAIEQIGAQVVMLGPDDLASGNLARFDAIVTGVRAYERRPDLRAHNQRLLEYARQGGTVIVQYNKFEFNEAQYGPFPAKVSSGRVTDENSPVKVLVPDHPVFNRPNKIGPSDWSGWVQERGLYFLGERDPQYNDLVELEDPFEYNKGVKRGALVEARVGNGRWIYLGLGLWRQLPAGTPGAYALMANLVSLKASGTTVTRR